jgi:hypothetical protein
MAVGSRRQAAGAIVFLGALLPNGRTILYTNAGALNVRHRGRYVVTGPVVTDGQWHHVVAVEDNAAADGVRTQALP